LRKSLVYIAVEWLCTHVCVKQLRDMEERLSNAYKLIEDLNEKLRRASDGSTGKSSIAQVGDIV